MSFAFPGSLWLDQVSRVDLSTLLHLVSNQCSTLQRFRGVGRCMKIEEGGKGRKWHGLLMSSGRFVKAEPMLKKDAGRMLPRRQEPSSSDNVTAVTKSLQKVAVFLFLVLRSL